MAGKYITIGQLAKRFEVSERTIKNWWLSGKTSLELFCPRHLIGSSGLRFTRKSVEVFEVECHVRPEDYTE